MPFKKILFGANKGKYKSPSGKVYTEEQVKKYYATKGFKENSKNKA